MLNEQNTLSFPGKSLFRYIRYFILHEQIKGFYSQRWKPNRNKKASWGFFFKSKHPPHQLLNKINYLVQNKAYQIHSGCGYKEYTCGIHFPNKIKKSTGYLQRWYFVDVNTVGFIEIEPNHKFYFFLHETVRLITGKYGGRFHKKL